MTATKTHQFSYRTLEGVDAIEVLLPHGGILEYESLDAARADLAWRYGVRPANIKLVTRKEA